MTKDIARKQPGMMVKNLLASAALALRPLLVVTLGPLAFAGGTLSGQAAPTAVRPQRLTVFAGVTGVDTGLYAGKNASVTAGVNLSFNRFSLLRPAVEIRGTLPIDRGNVDGQKNVLGGFRFSHPFGRVEPYGDVLAGLGQLRYRPYLSNPQGTFLYAYSSSAVYDFGGGGDIRMTRHFGLKLDVQAQHYSSPITDSGHLWAKTATIGLNYSFF